MCVATEMQLLGKSNELMIARWEQSVDAMDERDQVLKKNADEITQTKSVSVKPTLDLMWES